MAASDSTVRSAIPADAARCAAIYRPYVEDTAITFEVEVPTVAQMAARIEAARATHDWLVAEDAAGRVIGYAYAHAFNPRAAYQWSAETSIYIDDGHHRSGAGRKLYTRLLDRLAERGYRRAFAGITQPNESSNAFHRSFGFRDAGLYRRVGWKHDSWHDVAWMQLDLSRTGEPDGPPTPIV
ncbi:GCN5 family acetyltransferase [Mycobacterium paraense]|uniref:GCN5 family acetyltransferase n=1 Tax=Mycobacterium paraense TaxID=767916 RepID=A0A1X2AQY2_9MYCO|nr:GNAT family N-acetyltransferase [Mycobacterium paraense]ORW53781.1 GCN5 family acetyltransferase [Mycobacterium paraense]